MENALSAADVAAVTDRNYGYGGYGDGMFGGNGIWLFAILALMWGGNGGPFGNRNGERCATVEDINNSANFTRLESQVQGIGQSLAQQGTNLYNGICNLGYESLRNFNSLERQVAECCCTTQRNIDSVRFDMANYNAATNANIVAQVQSIKDMLCAEKAQAQAARIQQLELQQMFCGVPRFQPATVYGTIPFGWGFGFNGGCGCNNCGCGGNI